MTDLTDALELAWTNGAAHLETLVPEDLERPTACAGWDVRTLLNHTLGESMMFTEVNRRQAPGADHGDLVGDGASLVATWQAVARENVASWRAGGLEGDRTYPFGTFPAPASAVVNLGEVLVHTWDLATAVGRPATLDPDLVDLVLGLYSHVPMEAMRADGVFGPELAAADDAPATDRLLALLGRQP